MQDLLNTSKPFIIAEMSGNHNGSLQSALDLVRAAARCGVQALKLQTYTPDSLTIDLDSPDFRIIDKNSIWKGSSLYSLYQRAMTPWEWHQPVFEECKRLGIIGFSTPFDEAAVEYLEALNVPFYKIASFENIDIPLIRRVAQTGKPMIISLGLASLSEVLEAVETAKNHGCPRVILLKCTSAYPADPKDIHLNTIPQLQKLLGCEVGLSDHTLGIGVSVAAIALGARVIEKHFVISRKDGGVDSAFSLEPHEMAMLVREAAIAFDALGEIHVGPTEAEKSSIKFRRSIYIVQDIKQGETFSRENVRVIRPGYGLHPRYYDLLLGKQASSDLSRGQRLTWECVLK